MLQQDRVKQNLDLLEMIMNEKLDNLENETDDDLNLFICNIILLYIFIL